MYGVIRTLPDIPRPASLLRLQESQIERAISLLIDHQFHIAADERPERICAFMVACSRLGLAVENVKDEETGFYNVHAILQASPASPAFAS